MAKEFEVINVGTGPIIINNQDRLFRGEMKPVKLFIKEDGDLDHKPSFCFVMHGIDDIAWAQISLRMLNEGLRDNGYLIVKQSDLAQIKKELNEIKTMYKLEIAKGL